jgi:organic radical activating enzyme
VSHAVITGGEPLVNKGLGRLIEGLLASGPTFGVEVETSGVLAPAKGLPRDARLAWNLSPKMPSAEAKILPDPEILSRWIGEHRARLKIVIADEADWQAMETLLAQLPPEARQSTSVMPQARTREELSETQGWLLNRAMGSGLRVTTRMHVTAFGSKRGT